MEEVLTGSLAYLLSSAKVLPSASTFSAFHGLNDLAPLQLLRQRSKIKIPNVVAFDTTRRNVLESPYMIQTRILSSSLFLAYPSMPYEMRCAIAKELDEFFSELYSIRSVIASRPTLSPS